MPVFLHWRCCDCIKQRNHSLFQFYRFFPWKCNCISCQVIFFLLAGDISANTEGIFEERKVRNKIATYPIYISLFLVVTGDKNILTILKASSMNNVYFVNVCLYGHFTGGRKVGIPLLGICLTYRAGVAGNAPMQRILGTEHTSLPPWPVQS